MLCSLKSSGYRLEELVRFICAFGFVALSLKSSFNRVLQSTKMVCPISCLFGFRYIFILCLQRGTRK